MRCDIRFQTLRYFVLPFLKPLLDYAPTPWRRAAIAHFMAIRDRAFPLWKSWVQKYEQQRVLGPLVEEIERLLQGDGPQMDGTDEGGEATTVPVARGALLKETKASVTGGVSRAHRTLCVPFFRQRLGGNPQGVQKEYPGDVCAVHALRRMSSTLGGSSEAALSLNRGRGDASKFGEYGKKRT
uniref:Uncharacterized protein n=1 Tax=Chromera velia CCMP2878 TaxID=1169474 RepID=A0A0G4HY90_9ALVE|eukprot:Cvel_9438.t1-p1 / transcript=Cvel_9438.t1 / gene=Cvel_9438 / organism=Chromera_velia_CCMP2878 / gene_product=hypothetical protein / transcript_product=hypothetical protein / location=Cvel_scaffold544:37526-38071(+) / protein_length=182 / sequence_SO=supercontig / SO=protein_coding / is_pseudo=false